MWLHALFQTDLVEQTIYLTKQKQLITGGFYNTISDRSIYHAPNASYHRRH